MASDGQRRLHAVRDREPERERLREEELPDSAGPREGRREQGPRAAERGDGVEPLEESGQQPGTLHSAGVGLLTFSPYLSNSAPATEPDRYKNVICRVPMNETAVGEYPFR